MNCPELYIESHPYGGLFYFGGGYGGYGGDVWAIIILFPSKTTQKPFKNGHFGMFWSVFCGYWVKIG